MRSSLLCFALSLCLLPLSTLAQDTPDIDPETYYNQLEASLDYQSGTVEVANGIATLDLPASLEYLDPADTETVIVGWGNPPGGESLGMIVPAGIDPFSDAGWGVIITYAEDGHVDDSDAAAIDYDELLAQMQAETREESEARQEAGYGSMQLVGWAAPPHYDAQGHKLHWAKHLRFDEGESLNYNIRVLGRRGVLQLNAVAGMHQLADVERDMDEVLGAVAFNDGHRYDDFVDGDRIAAYGLGALVTGKLAAKAGLFAGLLKLLLAGKKFLILAIVGLVAIFRRFFRRGDASTDEATGQPA